MNRRAALVLLTLILLFQNSFLQKVMGADPFTHPELSRLKVVLLPALLSSTFSLSAVMLGCFLISSLMGNARSNDNEGIAAFKNNLARLAPSLLWCGWLPLMILLLVGDSSDISPARTWYMSAFGCVLVSYAAFPWRRFGVVRVLVGALSIASFICIAHYMGVLLSPFLPAIALATAAGASASVRKPTGILRGLARSFFVLLLAVVAWYQLTSTFSPYEEPGLLSLGIFFAELLLLGLPAFLIFRSTRV